MIHHFCGFSNFFEADDNDDPVVKNCFMANQNLWDEVVPLMQTAKWRTRVSGQRVAGRPNTIHFISDNGNSVFTASTDEQNAFVRGSGPNGAKFSALGDFLNAVKSRIVAYLANDKSKKKAAAD